MKTQRPSTPHQPWFFFGSEIVCLTAQTTETDQIEILENSAALQAVRQRETGIIQALFGRAGSLCHPEGWSIQTDRPCALQMRPDSKGQCHLTVASRNVRDRTIRIRLRFPGHNRLHVLELPRTASSSRSVTLIL